MVEPYMTAEEFAKLSPETPGLTGPLKALLLLKREGWEEAHSLVQDDDSAEAAWVHALIHRIEGDDSNAGYWYRQAGRKRFVGGIEEEWKAIVEELAKQR